MHKEDPTDMKLCCQHTHAHMPGTCTDVQRNGIPHTLKQDTQIGLSWLPWTERMQPPQSRLVSQAQHPIPTGNQGVIPSRARGKPD